METFMEKAVKAHMEHMDNMRNAPLFAARREAPGVKRLLAEHP